MRDMRESGATRRALGEILVERGALSAMALERASRLQAESGEPLSAVLTKLGLVSERALAEAFAADLALPLVAAKDFPESPVLDGRISRQFLKRARVSFRLRIAATVSFSPWPIRSMTTAPMRFASP